MLRRGNAPLSRITPGAEVEGPPFQSPEYGGSLGTQGTDHGSLLSQHEHNGSIACEFHGKYGFFRYGSDSVYGKKRRPESAGPGNPVD